MYETSILLVATDAEAINSFKQAVSGSAIRLAVASTAHEAIQHIASGQFDVLFVQTGPSGAPLGPALTKAIMSGTALPVVAVSRAGTIREAVHAMRSGASDYVTAPLEGPDTLGRVLQRVRRDGRQDDSTLQNGRGGKEGFLAVDRGMLAACDTLVRIAHLSAPALITGESGVGKTYLAQKMHALSPHRMAPFVKVVCGPLALREMERDLLGREPPEAPRPGGSHRSPPQLADGGTLLLHQASADALPFLPALLRRSGAGKAPLGFRLVLTCLRPVSHSLCQEILVECQRLGHSPVAVQAPPLRERVADIPLLAWHFALRLSRKHRRDAKEISPEAMARLVRYSWPGNVRELENAIEHGVMLSQTDTICADDLPETVLAQPEETARSADRTLPLKVALKKSEKDYLIQALESAGWNKKHVAKTLRISRSTLYAKMRQHGLDAESACWGSALPSLGVRRAW